MISKALIEETAYRLMFKAGIEIPDDYLAGIKAMTEQEEGDLSAFVLRAGLIAISMTKNERKAP